MGVFVDNVEMQLVLGMAERVLTVRIPRLHVRAGARVALTGPSGSGKTTVLDFLALLTRPVKAERYDLYTGVRTLKFTDDLTAGRLDRLAVHRADTVGYVPQIGGMIPFLSARRNAAVSCDAAGVRPDAARLADLAARLGLGDHLEKRRRQLSGGERKRVALLRALSLPRALLLADEPTTGLDDTNAETAMRLLAEAAEGGAACIIATHDPAHAAEHGFTPLSVRRSGESLAVLDPCGIVPEAG